MNNAEIIKNELAKYIIVLRDGLINCNRAEERPLYNHHLAIAAIMFAEIQIEFSIAKLKETVTSERRGYGWSYISDAGGLACERAFYKFAAIVENI
ncbi:MAG: hypothetical protein M3033_12640 [Acidobacteriota bacterium]|nr:hypothetical protein [Acidobacteriota bacterium]